MTTPLVVPGTNFVAEAIPTELRDRKQWVCWGGHETQTPLDKVPLTPGRGPASTTDPLTWSTFADAADYARPHHAGVGFVLSDDGPYTLVDIDGCIGDDGTIAPEAKRIIGHLEGYTEISPSGRGVHVFVRGRKTSRQCKASLPGAKGIEIYSTGRYATVTGRVLGTPMQAIPERQPQLDELCARLWSAPQTPSAPPSSPAPPRRNAGADIIDRASRCLEAIHPAVQGSGGHGALLYAAQTLTRGFELDRDSAIDLLWRCYNPRCVPPWDRSDPNDCRDFERKVDEALAHPLSDKPRGWLLHESRIAAGNAHGERDIAPLSFAELSERHQNLHPVVIAGLLRSGEVMNVISASKVGKSWLVYYVALSIAAGLDLWGAFACTPGRVLIVDNELHPPTIAYRIRTVAEAMGLDADLYADRIDVLPLRGRNVSLEELAPYIGCGERGHYAAIIIDAWYRAIPANTNENANADVMQLYNKLDQYAEATGAAFIVIHHSSKGAQGEKAVTDVGSGAGAQSRAADTHLVLRQHEENGHVVLEAAVRSFPPVEPVVLRWEYPLWVAVEGIDPTALKGRKSRHEEQRGENDAADLAKLSEAICDGSLTLNAACGVINAGKDRTKRLLSVLINTGRAIVTTNSVKGGTAHVYSRPI